MNAQDSSHTMFFGVDGMLVDVHPDPYAIAGLSGDGSYCFTALVDQTTWIHRGEYDAGVSDREFWDRIVGDCGQPGLPSVLLKGLVTLDMSRMTTVDKETPDLVRRLRRQAVRLGILSNAPYPIAKATRCSEWGGLFDFFASSCDYGVCKSSCDIYRDVLMRLNMPREDVVSIDDRCVNVRAAGLLGVQGVVWQSIENTETRLEELGILR